MERRLWHRCPAGKRDMFFFCCLGVLSASFFIGTVLGSASVCKEPDPVDTELKQYLLDYCRLHPDAGSGGSIFLSALAVYFRYPLAAFLLGFAAPGVILVPVLSAICGFFLSFSVGCFFDVFGKAGIPAAAAVFGPRCLIAVPAFFAIAIPAMQNAAAAARKLVSGGDRHALRQRSAGEHWLLYFVILAWLLLGVLLEVFVLPEVLRVVIKDFLF